MMRLLLLTTLFGVFPVCSLGQEVPTHSLLLADSSKNRIAIIDESGKLIWESKIGPLHDLHRLANGNVLFQRSWTELAEVEPESGRVVWEYDAAGQSEGNDRKVEVHAFQRLANGNTMIAESGIPRIVEVDAAGMVTKAMPLQVRQSHPHRDTRLVRKLAGGSYLVCHEGDGRVREYAEDGGVVWDYEIPLFGKQPAAGHGPDAFGNQCFAALRLDNGNVLISTGNGHSIIEVNPQKEIVWKIDQNDLPGVRLAWVTTLQVLPNGHIVLGNCHAGEDQPQVIEVTRDKQVVWTFQDFERFGNALTNTQVLSTDGIPINARLGIDR